MGVKGLWGLVESAGQPVTLESLEGKRLAVDVSLWLHQAAKANAGVRNAHLSVLFRRVAKLLFFGIKPVFVFDGPQVPAFKAATLGSRRLRRERAAVELDKARKSLIARAAAEELDGERSEQKQEQLKQKIRAVHSAACERDAHELPEDEPSFDADSDLISSSTDEENEEEEKNNSAANSSFDCAELLEVESDHFYSLPIAEQRELLLDSQEGRKQSRSNFAALPVESNEFSSFQMKRLLNKNKVNTRLEEINRQLVTGSCHRQNKSSVMIVHEGHKRQHILLKDDADEQFHKTELIDLIEDNDQPVKLANNKSNDLTTSGLQNGGQTVATTSFQTNISNYTLCGAGVSTPLYSCSKNEKSDSAVKRDAEKIEQTKADICVASDVSDADKTDSFVDVPNLVFSPSPTAVEEESSTVVTFELPTIEVVISQEMIKEKRECYEKKSAKSQESQSNIGETQQSDSQRFTKIRETLETQEKLVAKSVYDDCETLLTLFGVPFVRAPGEAEAQCAVLEKLGLVSGTIGDDSDMWLFGAKNVYRHVFQRDQYVHLYTEEGIRDKFGLSQRSLILLAMLCGCDYTNGVSNIGAISALEVLADFCSDEFLQSSPTDGSDSILEPLKRFLQWYECRSSDCTNATRERIRKKNLEFPDGFPNSAIFEAFYRPIVDNSEEQFSWGTIDGEGLGKFALEKIGWPASRSEQLLAPVLAKWNSCCSSQQKKITEFFTPAQLPVISAEPSQLFPSRRVRDAVGKLTLRQRQATNTSNIETRATKTDLAAVETKMEKRRKRPTVFRPTKTRKRRAAAKKAEAVLLKITDLSESSDSD